MRQCRETRSVSRWLGCATVAWWLCVAIMAPGVSGMEEPVDDPGKDLRERLAKKISIEVRKMPLEDVIRLMTEQADVDIVVSPNVKGEATVKLTDVTLEEALRGILEVHGCDYVIGDNIIRILTHEEIPAVPERQTTELIEVTYADAAEVVKSLESFKSESGSVTHMQGTSHILIIDREQRVKAMMEFVKQVDRMTPQILVEAHLRRHVQGAIRPGRAVGSRDRDDVWDHR